MTGTKTAAKLVRVAVDVRPGQASVAQKQAWKLLFQRLIAEVKASTHADKPKEG